MQTVLVVLAAQLAPDGTVRIQLGRPAQFEEGEPAGYLTVCRLSGVAPADAFLTGSTVSLSLVAAPEAIPEPITVPRPPPGGTPA